MTLPRSSTLLYVSLCRCRDLPLLPDLCSSSSLALVVFEGHFLLLSLCLCFFSAGDVLALACWGSSLLRPPVRFRLCFCQRSLQYGANGPGDAREGCDCSNKRSKWDLGGATRDNMLMALPSSREQREGRKQRRLREERQAGGTGEEAGGSEKAPHKRWKEEYKENKKLKEMLNLRQGNGADRATF